MKARIKIELPPGVEDTHDVRAKLVSALSTQLGVAPHANCDHGDLEKAEMEPKKLPHKMPQALIDRVQKAYQEQMSSMLDEITAVLAE